MLWLRARHYEAHLLAALQDAEAPGGASAARFRDHFRRINRILRDPDRVFPDPRERLLFEELDRLTREFIETSLVATGVEWFRQRVAAGPEARRVQELGLRRHAQRGGRGPRRQLALPAPQLARHPAPAQRRSTQEGPAAAGAARLGPAARVPRRTRSGCSGRAGRRRASRKPTRGSGPSGSAGLWPTSAEAGRSTTTGRAGGEAGPAATVSSDRDGSDGGRPRDRRAGRAPRGPRA